MELKRYDCLEETCKNDINEVKVDDLADSYFIAHFTE